MGESLTGHIASAENCGDSATKTTIVGRQRRCLVSKLLYHVCDCEDKNTTSTADTPEV